MRNVVCMLLFFQVLGGTIMAADVEHPHLLFGKDDIATIKARSADPQLKAVTERLFERAELLLTAPPLKVSLTMRGEADAPGELKGIEASRRMQGRVLTYCMAFTLRGEKKYRDAAVAELDHALTDWKIWVDTAHPPPYDLMTGETCMTFGLAYDWLYNDLTTEERTRLREGVIKRGLSPFLEGIEKKMWWNSCQTNWNTVCNAGGTVLALALAGETELSAKALATSVPNMKPYWDHLGDDGGWDEGTGYWTYGNRYAIIAAEALRRSGNKVRRRRLRSRRASNERVTFRSSSIRERNCRRASATPTGARRTRSSICSAASTRIPTSSGSRTAPGCRTRKRKAGPRNLCR